MFQKVFEYAGPHKKGLYAATAIVLVSVLLGVFPFVLAYQVIAPLVMGEAITASFIIQHVILVLVCLVLQALFYGWGLNLSHKAAYDTLLRLRTALPNLILVLCLSLSIGMPLLKSLGFLPTMPQLNYKISALEQVLDAPELQQTNDRFHGIDDTITYDHVSFAYQTTQPGPDGKPAVVEDEVLHDISFTAKAGQKTALVGESGSGKSTLAKLLIHYYDPQKGSISIGGQKLCDMSLEALNSRISYVAQDQYLFNTSLLENIRLGRLTATDEEVLEAAKKAQCMEFIEKLPQGIHSMAGDAGKMLSGGQRQRISLARAILKDAPIVVLDEATAYADPENEEKMEAAIAELVKGKTLVVIAHKLPAIMNADQICVIDHGKLVAAGKHQELIRSCPEYQKLWKAAQDSAEWKVHTAKEGA